MPWLQLLPSDCPGRSTVTWLCSSFSPYPSFNHKAFDLQSWLSMPAPSCPRDSFLSSLAVPPDPLPRRGCQRFPPRKGSVNVSPALRFFRTACGGRTSPVDRESSALVWILTGTGSQALEVPQSAASRGQGWRENLVLGTSPTQSDYVDA